jgi:Fe-S-cluster-containing dehydrogenase component/formate-dependent nitrite reductase membrane component NrfD
MRWAKVIDHTSCIGCHACTTACKSENEVPLSVTRTYVKYVDVGLFPHARRAFQVTRCNQCDDAPCVAACPTAAMFTRRDGIVDFNKEICIGCKACMAACPYDAIFINPEDRAAEKCNFCAHRLDVGLEPACVVVCPTAAIIVGDLHDPASKVARMVQREAVAVRRPEKETFPKLFYRGAHQATLDPLAARRPGGGLFLWSEQQHSDPQAVVSGHPGHANSSAAALLSYDVGHQAPWGWRVSLYTWTKGIAAGAYLVAALFLLLGLLQDTSALWRWSAPLLAGVFLALTGGLLIWDLKHPDRFLLIFTRPQWRSWLVRGAFVILAFAALLAAHVLSSALGIRAGRLLAAPGVVLSGMTAAYTAYLFAQARGRDLWQSPLLPPHLLVQAAMLGAAALLPFAVWQAPDAVAALLWTLGGASLAHLLLVLGETTLVHATAHARLAAWEMTHGRFRAYFWGGVLAVAAAVLAPWAGALVAPLALAGVMAHEHAYVQAGQAVPLA